MNKKNILFIISIWVLFLSIAQSQRPLPKDLGDAGTIVGVPEPVIKWDFNLSDHDLMEDLSGHLVGGAKIENGKLCLTSAGSYFKSDPLPFKLKEKTMVAQVYLSTLDQRGGGLITVESLNGVTFDSIVFGEGKARTWNNGSEHGVRIKGIEGAEETADSETPIWMAISYAKNGAICLYKNGVLYRSIINPDTPLQHYQKKKTDILIGKRHEGGGNPYLSGKIEYAEIYDEPLGDEQIKCIYEKSRSKYGVPRQNKSTVLDQLPDKILLITHESYSDSLIRSAQNGDAQAQVDLAYAYSFGKGVAKSREQAFIWNEKAAEQGNANALFNMSSYYADGFQVPKNMVKAVELLKISSEKGFAPAQDELALKLCRGEGVKENEAEAFQWHLRAAQQGWYPAFLRVSNHLQKGLGITKNQDYALRWERLADKKKSDWESSVLATDWRNNSITGAQMPNGNASSNSGKPASIRRRRLPVSTQGNSSLPIPKPDQIQSPTNPQQNP